jgi:hypothetical protein
MSGIAARNITTILVGVGMYFNRVMTLTGPLGGLGCVLMMLSAYCSTVCINTSFSVSMEVYRKKADPSGFE